MSINVFEQIDQVCKDFRRQWKKGPPPRIEDFLELVGSQARDNLFRNLLHIEIEARRRANEQPSSDDYIQRFPDFARIIRQAFFQSTMASMSADQETSRISRTISFEVPAANRLGEYLLIGELGRGGFGVVYDARHIQHGNRVALKTLPTGLTGQQHPLDDAERLHRFRREFRRMADLSHPNLVGMQTLEVDGSQWFFTMDLVEGIDFLGYVRPQGVLNETRLRATLPQLVSGVMALHGQHVVHRDLKPGNVLINDDGHVSILDFGLVAELQERTDIKTSVRFAGTPAYAAPEQTSEHLTAAGDWYALGVMLYEALTGEVPFSGSWLQLLEKKRKEDAPRLVGRDAIPEDLAQLADKLLARDPQQRPDALAITKAVSASTTLVQVRGPSDQLLIGRESQLAVLEQARQQLVQSREPQTISITGRSGEGKTALAEHFVSPLRGTRELAILSGRCYDRESVPLKALDSLIDGLCNFLQSQKQDAAQLLPDDIRMLVQLFPVLRRVEAVAKEAGDQPVQLDMKQVRQRAFHALREMLKRIGRRSPVIIFIDDLQWGDADSAQAIFEILQPPDPPAVLFLGSFRSDEADDSPFLTEWRKRSASARCGKPGHQSRPADAG